jgi:hypothetical protein
MNDNGESKVAHLPASPYLEPAAALRSAERLDWKDVLIIGYDADGFYMQRSSRMTRQEALWIIEAAKRELFSGE